MKITQLVLDERRKISIMAPVLTMTQRNDNAGIAQLVERNLAKVEVAPNIKNGDCIYAFAVLVLISMLAHTKHLF